MEATSLCMSLGVHVVLLCSVRWDCVLYVGHIDGFIGDKTFGGSLGLWD